MSSRTVFWRSIRSSIAFLLLLAAPLSGQATTAITNALIIDGYGGTPLENGTLVFRSDRILEVGSASNVRVPDGAIVIDAAGKAVMPGLVDGHIHLMGGWDGYAVDMLGIQKYLNSLLYAGVTRALDLGNVLYFISQIQQEIEGKRMVGPALHYAGPLISGPGSPWAFLSLVVTETMQVPGYAEMLADGGVEALKIYPGLSPEQRTAVAKEAEERSLPLIAHIRPGPGYGDVLRSGIDASAHLPRHEIPDEDVRYMGEHGISCITTLAQYESTTGRRFGDPSFLSDPLIQNTTAPWILEDLKTHADRIAADADSARVVQIEAFFEGLRNTTQRLIQGGVMLVAGTDAPYPGVFFGEGIHRELELLVEAGLPPLDAISAATRNPAMLMNQEGEWGTLSPGAVADILVIDGDPSSRISDTRRVDMVIQGGRLVDRKTLVFDEERDPGFRIRRGPQ
jgi:imidazolonepropionase-like amidohydrolase